MWGLVRQNFVDSLSHFQSNQFHLVEFLFMMLADLKEDYHYLERSDILALFLWIVSYISLFFFSRTESCFLGWLLRTGRYALTTILLFSFCSPSPNWHSCILIHLMLIFFSSSSFFDSWARSSSILLTFYCKSKSSLCKSIILSSC